MIKSFIKIFWELLKIPLALIGAVILIFMLLIFINVVIGYLKGKRIPKGTFKEYKRPSVFRRIFVDFPRQKAEDIFNFDPDNFKYKGCVVFTGRQGNGKSIAMVEFATRVKAEYPNSKLITNYAVTFQDSALSHWRQLTDYSNGKYGVMVLMDELQNWFSSNASKNFPPEMLQVITQNRKNRRIICGTAQNFYLLAKPIRSQCTEVRECRTFFGCITVVSRREPVLDCNGDVKEWKKLGRYFFIHSKELRDSYDTYKVIETLAASGFKDNADALTVKF